MLISDASGRMERALRPEPGKTGTPDDAYWKASGGGASIVHNVSETEKLTQE